MYSWAGERASACGLTAADHWAGGLISGRCAQKYDAQTTFWEGFTSIPFSLASAAHLKFRGSLPHRDEIAVDEATMKRRHKLYIGASGPDDRQAYANQFLWRKNTAVQHIRQAYQRI